jgi:hydroxymethylbilane synthase
MCPAVGQGALAIETREEGEAVEACSELEDSATRAAVEAERGVLRTLGGGCQVPIGAHATVSGGSLRLVGIVGAPDGSRIVRRETSGSTADAVQLGEQLGAELLAAGGAEILAAVYGG